MALLMGPSGSGKSTLLAVLSGLLQPDGGQVTGFGTGPWTMSEIAARALPPEALRLHLSGLQPVRRPDGPAAAGDGGALGRRRFGRRARRRADEMLSLLGLGKKAHLRPAELSGGEKQRVAIGRALIKEPDFCFADEPTSALDWEHGEQVIELLRNAAHERNSTVLIVAHDARIIPYVDRVYNLEDGCLHEGEEETARPGPTSTPAATATSRLTFPASIEEFPPMNRAIKALSRPRLNVWLVGVLAATAAGAHGLGVTSRADCAVDGQLDRDDAFRHARQFHGLRRSGARRNAALSAAARPCG